MSTLLSPYKREFLKQHQSIAVACSGGMDSMALCDSMLKHSIPFSILHVNFQLRGEDSDQDEQFVKKFGEKHSILVYVASYDTYQLMKENKTSLEIEARNLRYAFFEQMIQEHKFDLVLTAHHAQDQAETILMRIIKGVGIQGMMGIPKLRNGIYYRPLLNVKKEEILEYVHENNVKYRDDVSNQNTDILRNKLRLEVIPELEKINPNFSNSLINISETAIEVNEIIDELFQPLKQKLEEDRELDLTTYQTKKYLQTLLYYLLSEYDPSRDEIQRISSVISSPESKTISIGMSLWEVKNGCLYKTSPSASLELETYENINQLAKNYNLEITNHISANFEQNTLYIDKKKLKFPIRIRAIKEGDRMKPLGMEGRSKKVNDLIKKYKWTQKEKASIKIMEDRDGEIVAILFSDISEKLKIQDTTQEIIILKPKN